jgi:hypothetical protein
VIYLTNHGRRVAAIVPAGAAARLEQDTADARRRLGVPREYMGLAFVAMPAGAGGESSSGRRLPGAASEEDDPVQRRDFIGATVAVMIDANALAYERWLPRAAAHPAPPPARIGASDVAWIRRTTDLLHSLGNQLGGHATMDAVTGYLRSTSALLRSSSLVTARARRGSRRRQILVAARQRPVPCTAHRADFRMLGTPGRCGTDRMDLGRVSRAATRLGT